MFNMRASFAQLPNGFLIIYDEAFNVLLQIINQFMVFLATIHRMILNVSFF